MTINSSIMNLGTAPFFNEILKGVSSGGKLEGSLKSNMSPNSKPGLYKSPISHLFFLAILFFVPGMLEAVGGNGSERGGGNAYHGTRGLGHGTSPVFLDLRVFDSTFEESPSSDQTPLPETRFLKKIGYERLYPSRMRFYQEILIPRLDRASSFAPKLTSALRMLFEGGVDGEGFGILYVRKSSIRLSFEKSRAHLPTHFHQTSPGKVIPFIHYNLSLGAVILANTWDQFGPLSQSAATLHEAFRELQIAYDLEFLTDEILQNLVGEIILMRNPQILRDTEAQFSTRESLSLTRATILREYRRALTIWLCESESFLTPRIKFKKFATAVQLMHGSCKNRPIKMYLNDPEIALLGTVFRQILTDDTIWTPDVYASGQFGNRPNDLAKDAGPIKIAIVNMLETVFQYQRTSLNLHLINEMQFETSVSNSIQNIQILRQGTFSRLTPTSEVLVRGFLETGALPSGYSKKAIQAQIEKLSRFFKTALENPELIHYFHYE